MNAPGPVSSKFQSSPNDADSSSESLRVSTPTRVLFFVPYGMFGVHNQVDAVLAVALRLRGAEVCVVRCDGIYPVCDVVAWAGASSKEECVRCAGYGFDLFTSMALPVLQMRNYLKPADYADAARWAKEVPVSSYSSAEWNGVPIGEWVTSSVFTYFRTTPRGLGRPEVQDVHRRFLETGVLTWLALSRIMDEYQPMQCVTFNGRMAPFRVALELAGQRGIPVLIHERGWVDDTFIFYENENCLATQPIFDCADQWGDIPLTSAECLRVKDYLASREYGKGMNFPSFYNYKTEYATARHALRIPKHARVLLVFTSSEFEFAESDYYRGICDQLELIDRLIEVFRHREEYLVIRHHPYIAGTNQVLADYHFLTRAYGQIAAAPENVRIIMPSEPLSSYALFWSADACISFLSTAGVEALARGLPTAALPESMYRQTMCRLIEQSSVESLAGLVDDLLRQTATFGVTELRRVCRFLHACIDKLPKRFKSFGIKNHFEPDMRFRTVDDLAPGEDSELDVLCEHLLNGASFRPTPDASDRAKDDTEENEFLQEQMAGMLEQRVRVQRQSGQFLHWRLGPAVAILRIAWTGRHAPDFTAWAARSFRHRQIQEYECQIDAELRHPEVMRAILSGLMTVREDYVLITWNSVRHDESVISCAVDQLLDDAGLAIDGVIFGAWLVSADNGITGEIFTGRVPAATYEEALTLLPALREPQTLLPFGLFRRSKLLPLLEEISLLPDAEAAARRLFSALRVNSFHHRLLPMLALTQP